MSNEHINLLIGLGSIFLYIFGIVFIYILITHLEQNYELKKLKISNPQNQKTTIEKEINNEKLKFRIKSWSINIIAIFIICLITKLFGFNIKDIIEFLK